MHNEWRNVQLNFFWAQPGLKDEDVQIWISKTFFLSENAAHQKAPFWGKDYVGPQENPHRWHQRTQNEEVSSSITRRHALQLLHAPAGAPPMDIPNACARDM